MNDQRGFRVTVGVDGSASSLDAVRWAAAEAAARAGGLRVVHAWLWPMMPVPPGPAMPQIRPAWSSLHRMAPAHCSGRSAEASATV